MAANMQDFCMVRQPPSASRDRAARCSISAMARTPLKVAVGNNLRLAIEAVEKSQAEFARRIDVAPNKLHNWLRGENFPDVDALIRACDEYGLTMDWFYRGHRAGVAASVADSLRKAAQASSAAAPAEVSQGRGEK